MKKINWRRFFLILVLLIVAPALAVYLLMILGLIFGKEGNLSGWTVF